MGRLPENSGCHYYSAGSFCFTRAFHAHLRLGRESALPNYIEAFFIITLAAAAAAALISDATTDDFHAASRLTIPEPLPGRRRTDSHFRNLSATTDIFRQTAIAAMILPRGLPGISFISYSGKFHYFSFSTFLRGCASGYLFRARWLHSMPPRAFELTTRHNTTPLTLSLHVLMDCF